MLKLAGLFLVLMIVFGILGFVVNVSFAIAKFLFFFCAIAFAISLAAKFMKNRGDETPAA